MLDCWQHSNRYFKLIKHYQYITGGLDSCMNPGEDLISAAQKTSTEISKEREYLTESCPRIFEFNKFIRNYR